MKELGVVPDAIVIPVGGGGLLAGMTTVIEHLTPHIKIIVSLSVAPMGQPNCMVQVMDLCSDPSA